MTKEFKKLWVAWLRASAWDLIVMRHENDLRWIDRDLFGDLVEWRNSMKMRDAELAEICECWETEDELD